MATAFEEQDIDAELQAALEEEQRKREEARIALAQAEARGAGIRDMPVDGFIEPAANQLLPNYSAPQPTPDKHAAYQSFVNTLNPNTAAQGRQELAMQGLDTADPYENAPPAQPGPNADTQSRRLFGRNEFQRLVSAGVPPADAYARVAADLLSGDTAATSRVIAPSRRTAPEPPAGTASVRINRDPETGEVFSRSILNPSGTVQSTTRVAPPAAPKMPQNNADERKLIEGKIRALQANPFGSEADKSEVEKLRGRYMELGTNWQGSASSPAAPSTGPARSKVEQANGLARKNPSWTRKQIIDAVNQGR